MNLKDRRIVITGASSGIGHALALALAQDNHVLITGRSAQRLDALRAQLAPSAKSVIAVSGDLTDAAVRQQIVAQASLLGGIDILINSAGVGTTGYLAEGPSSYLLPIFEINFFAAVELTRLALPHLKNSKSPLVVNIASVAGRRGIPGYSEYSASKFALSGWSEAIRAEFARFGIGVLLVCPAAVDTPAQEHFLEDRLGQPRPLRAMSAPRCAEAIVAAMRADKKEIALSVGGNFLLWLNRLWPRAVDKMLAVKGDKG